MLDLVSHLVSLSNQTCNLVSKAMQSLILKSILGIHIWYNYLWTTILAYFGPIAIIYHLDGFSMKNITLNYYLNYNLNKYSEGSYYVIIYNSNESSQIAFKGVIGDIDRIIRKSITDCSYRRKNIMLLNNGMPLNTNLEILDKYKRNTQYFGESSITNLSTITKLMKLTCTHISIFELRPFKKTILDIAQVDINDIYHHN